MSAHLLPSLPYESWAETKATLHLVCQILGKIKLARNAKLPHWWHTTLHVTPSGISTQTIATADGNFCIDLDIHTLKLRMTSSRGLSYDIDLQKQSVAEVYQQVMNGLNVIGHPTSILARPYDNPHSDIPFAEDTSHHHWDHESIKKWWQSLVFIDEVFKHFAGASFVRTSPVHLFWHSFDFVVTRFSGQTTEDTTAGARRSDAEAYSHEVISFGFWPGDPKVPFPAFYSYTAPEPDGLAQAPLQPTQAWWQELPGSHLAMLKWEDLRQQPDPRAALLAFMQSAYTAGCHHSRWEQYQDKETTPYWNQLDEKFPLTRGKEHRLPSPT